MRFEQFHDSGIIYACIRCSTGIISRSNRRGTSLPSSIAVPFPRSPYRLRDAFGDALALVVPQTHVPRLFRPQTGPCSEILVITNNFLSPQSQSPWSYSAPRELYARARLQSRLTTPKWPAHSRFENSRSSPRNFTTACQQTVLSRCLQLSLIPLTPGPICPLAYAVAGKLPAHDVLTLKSLGVGRGPVLSRAVWGWAGLWTRRKYFMPAAIYMALKPSSQLPAFGPLALLSPLSCFATYCCDCCCFCELLRNASLWLQNTGISAFTI